jgi:hypothetical protein
MWADIQTPSPLLKMFSLLKSPYLKLPNNFLLSVSQIFLLCFQKVLFGISNAYHIVLQTASLNIVFTYSS